MSTVARIRGESVGSKWSLTEATELYDVDRWGQGYFSINVHGHLQVHPTKDPARAVDLKRLIDRGPRIVTSRRHHLDHANESPVGKGATEDRLLRWIERCVTRQRSRLE